MRVRQYSLSFRGSQGYESMSSGVIDVVITISKREGISNVVVDVLDV
jgi:hypothetical protein